MDDDGRRSDLFAVNLLPLSHTSHSYDLLLLQTPIALLELQQSAGWRLVNIHNKQTNGRMDGHCNVDALRRTVQHRMRMRTDVSRC